MRIGLYTLHNIFNVGAMLQAFALSVVLKRFGCEVEIINVLSEELDKKNHYRGKIKLSRSVLRYFYKFAHPGIKKMETNFERFHSMLPLTRRYYSDEEYMSAPNLYDLHLVGSDQVWNTQKGFVSSQIYFLDYLPKGTLKKSYASSFGTTTKSKDHLSIKNALTSFASISVREDTAVDFVSSLTGSRCELVLDPTLLLSSEEWDNYLDKDSFLDGKYIFYYGVNGDKNTWDILKRIKRHLNAKLVGYPGPLPPKYKFDKYIFDGGPLQFVDLVRNAELVVTSSYHGLAFAINYSKKFILVRYGERMERMDSLLRQLGAERYIAYNPMDVDEILKDYNLEKLADIQEKLCEARTFSLNWIKQYVLEDNK